MNEDERFRRNTMSEAVAGALDQFSTKPAPKDETIVAHVSPWMPDPSGERRQGAVGYIRLPDAAANDPALSDLLISLADRALRSAGRVREHEVNAAVTVTIELKPTAWNTVASI